MTALKTLRALQAEIFKKTATDISLGPKIANTTSPWTQLIDYYPPDISPHKLAKQDPTLAEFKLRDKWLDTKVDREIMLRRRNKPIRVSALLGPIKPAEGAGGKKKKKRK